MTEGPETGQSRRRGVRHHGEVASSTRVNQQEQERTLMNVSKFLSRLKADDVKEDMLVTVEAVYETDVFDKDRDAEKALLAVKFAEVDSEVACGPTQVRQLVDAFRSTESDNWVGKKIIMWNDPSVTFNNRKVGGIRFKSASESELSKPRK